jgi:CRP-like cAMP-binding protein
VILRNGQSFGEIALRQQCKRTASAVTRTPTILGILDRITYRKIIEDRGMMDKFVIETLPHFSMLSLFDELTLESISKGFILETFNFN